MLDDSQIPSMTIWQKISSSNIFPVKFSFQIVTQTSIQIFKRCASFNNFLQKYITKTQSNLDNYSHTMNFNFSSGRSLTECLNFSIKLLKFSIKFSLLGISSKYEVHFEYMVFARDRIVVIFSVIFSNLQWCHFFRRKCQ